MVKFLFRILNVALLFAASCGICFAGASDGVVFSEVAWMGTKASYADEWIEFFNSSDEDVDVSGWEVVSGDNVLFELTGKIEANGFFLIEKSEATTKTEADFIPSKWTKSLPNTCQSLKLQDGGAVIDLIGCKNGWKGGNAKERATMAKDLDTGMWGTSQVEKYKDREGNENFGTPGGKNNIWEVFEEDEVANDDEKAVEEISLPVFNFASKAGTSINERIISYKTTDSFNSEIRIRSKNSDVMVQNEKGVWLYSSDAWNKNLKLSKKGEFRIRFISGVLPDAIFETRDSNTLKTRDYKVEINAFESALVDVDDVLEEGQKDAPLALGENDKDPETLEEMGNFELIPKYYKYDPELDGYKVPATDYSVGTTFSGGSFSLSKAVGIFLSIISIPVLGLGIWMVKLKREKSENPDISF